MVEEEGFKFEECIVTEWCPFEFLVFAFKVVKGFGDSSIIRDESSIVVGKSSVRSNIMKILGCRPGLYARDLHRIG